MPANVITLDARSRCALALAAACAILAGCAPRSVVRDVDAHRWADARQLVLVTSFEVEPFGDETVNWRWAAMEALAGRSGAGVLQLEFQCASARFQEVAADGWRFDGGTVNLDQTGSVVGHRHFCQRIAGLAGCIFDVRGGTGGDCECCH